MSPRQCHIKERKAFSFSSHLHSRHHSALALKTMSLERWPQLPSEAAVRQGWAWWTPPGRAEQQWSPVGYPRVQRERLQWSAEQHLKIPAPAEWHKCLQGSARPSGAAAPHRGGHGTGEPAASLFRQPRDTCGDSQEIMRLHRRLRWRCKAVKPESAH